MQDREPLLPPASVAEFPLPIMMPASEDLMSLKADQANLRKRARQDRVSLMSHSSLLWSVDEVAYVWVL